MIVESDSFRFLSEGTRKLSFLDYNRHYTLNYKNLVERSIEVEDGIYATKAFDGDEFRQFKPEVFFTSTASSIDYTLKQFNYLGSEELLATGKLNGYNSGNGNYYYRFDFSNYIKIVNKAGEEAKKAIDDYANRKFNVYYPGLKTRALDLQEDLLCGIEYSNNCTLRFENGIQDLEYTFWDSSIQSRDYLSPYYTSVYESEHNISNYISTTGLYRKLPDKREPFVAEKFYIPKNAYLPLNINSFIDEYTNFSYTPSWYVPYAVFPGLKASEAISIRAYKSDGTYDNLSFTYADINFIFNGAYHSEYSNIPPIPGGSNKITVAGDGFNNYFGLTKTFLLYISGKYVRYTISLGGENLEVIVDGCIETTGPYKLSPQQVLFTNIYGGLDYTIFNGKRYETSKQERDYIEIGNKKVNTKLNITRQVKMNTGYNYNWDNLLSLLQADYCYLSDSQGKIRSFTVDTNIYKAYYQQSGRARFTYEKKTDKNMEIVFNDPKKYVTRIDYKQNFFNLDGYFNSITK